MAALRLVGRESDMGAQLEIMWIIALSAILFFAIGGGVAWWILKKRDNAKKYKIAIIVDIVSACFFTALFVYEFLSFIENSEIFTLIEASLCLAVVICDFVALPKLIAKSNDPDNEI
ncbi:MAG: hypothetical protein RR107_06060, partial [Clostridia bacterium]